MTAVARAGLSLVKGLRHETLDEVELGASGPVGDRRFCLVDPEQRAVLRTVRHPELVQVRARRVGVALALDLPGGTVADTPAATGELVECDYWGRSPELELLRYPPAAMLGELTGRSVALAAVRRTGDVVYGAPVTVVTTTELDRLAARAGWPGLVEDSARFRATLTVDDRDQPWPQDPTGGRLRVGEAEVRINGPIPRCRVVDAHPSTGRMDRHLLAALAGYRRAAGAVHFGWYAEVLVPGRVHPGDDVCWRA
ncbi:MAG: MOSC domain-containing protein [Marmoricola sp.]